MTTKFKKDKYADGRECWIATDDEYRNAIGYGETKELAEARLKIAVEFYKIHR